MGTDQDPGREALASEVTSGAIRLRLEGARSVGVALRCPEFAALTGFEIPHVFVIMAGEKVRCFDCETTIGG